MIGAIASRFVGGTLVDVAGRRRTLLVALGAYVILSFLYLPSDSLGMLIAVRLLHGVAFGLGNTAVSASVQALLPPARRAEGTGYFMLSTSLSIAVGPLIAVQLAAGGHYLEMFWLSTASAAGGLVVALILRPPELPAERRPRARDVQWLRPATMVEARAVPIAVVSLFCGAAYSSILALASAYSAADGHPGSSAWFFGAYAVSMVVPRLFAGRLQDRWGPGVVLWPAFAMFAARLSPSPPRRARRRCCSPVCCAASGSA